jgi:tRNA-(guanine-N1)-methyltransferase
MGKVKSPPESYYFQVIHAKIKGWRLSQFEAITRRQRPDFGKNI